MKYIERELPKHMQFIKDIIEKVYADADKRLQEFTDKLVEEYSLVMPVRWGYIDTHPHISFGVPSVSLEVRQIIKDNEEIFKPIIHEKQQVSAFLIHTFNYWGDNAWQLMPYLVPSSVTYLEQEPLSPAMVKALADLEKRPEAVLMKRRIFLEGMMS